MKGVKSHIKCGVPIIRMFFVPCNDGIWISFGNCGGDENRNHKDEEAEELHRKWCCCCVVAAGRDEDRGNLMFG